MSKGDHVPGAFTDTDSLTILCHTHSFNDSNLKPRLRCHAFAVPNIKHGMADGRPTDASATYYSGPLQLIQIDEAHGMAGKGDEVELSQWIMMG